MSRTLVKLYLCQTPVPWRKNEKLAQPPNPKRVRPTLGLGFLKSNCESRDFRIQVVNTPRHLGNCDLIGLSATAFGLREAISILEQADKAGIPVVLGGYGTLWEPILEYGFKHIVRGDGELVLADILAGAAQEKVLCREVQDLDTLKFPHRQNCDKVLHGLSSRGCCFRCTFCSFPKHNRLRFHSPEWFVDDLVQAHRKFPHVGRVTLHDDLFAISEKRVDEVRKVWMAKGVNKMFSHVNCNVRADRLTPGMAKMLRSMNFLSVRIGIESASERVLQILGKNESPADMEKAIRILRKADILVHGNMIEGVPGATREDWEVTERFMERFRKMGGVKFGIFKFWPLPGTALYDGTNPLTYDVEYDKKRAR